MDVRTIIFPVLLPVVHIVNCQLLSAEDRIERLLLPSGGGVGISLGVICTTAETSQRIRLSRRATEVDCWEVVGSANSSWRRSLA